MRTMTCEDWVVQDTRKESCRRSSTSTVALPRCKCCFMVMKAPMVLLPLPLLPPPLYFYVFLSLARFLALSCALSPYLPPSPPPSLFPSLSCIGSRCRALEGRGAVCFSGTSFKP